jgi:hypothetical protein
MIQKPIISFTFPYRWLVEDKEFLSENLRRMVERYVGRDGVDELRSLMVYRVHVSYTYREPIQLPLTKTAVQKALRPYMPIARCLDLTLEYKFHKSKTMLPVCEFQMYA